VPYISNSTRGILILELLEFFWKSALKSEIGLAKIEPIGLVNRVRLVRLGSFTLSV
jgi:hypothetical protein